MKNPMLNLMIPLMILLNYYALVSNFVNIAEA